MTSTIKFYIVLLLIFNSLISFSQSSFSYLISTPDDEILYDAAEDVLGNYYAVGRKYNSESGQRSAYFIVLNNDGELSYEQELLIEDTNALFGSIQIVNESIVLFGLKGPTSTEHLDNFFVQTLNMDLIVVNTHTYKFPNYSILDFRVNLNGDSNFIISGILQSPIAGRDLFLLELSGTGDSLRQAIHNWQEIFYTFDLIQSSNDIYKIFGFGNFPGAPETLGVIAKFDQDFNYIMADSIPYGLYFNHSAKRLTDSSIIVTGNKHLFNPFNVDIAVAVLTESDELIIGNHFGRTGDTADYVGSISNLDINPQGNVYFGGTSNVNPSVPFYSTDYSWLMLVNLNSSLELNWEKEYGGDAYYYLWGMISTLDGGCLMIASRWDYLVQDLELDALILKVDSTGLVTGINDTPSEGKEYILVSPNPSSGRMVFQFPGVSQLRDGQLLILNTLGEIVAESDITGNTDRFPQDLSYLPYGLYFASILSNGNRVATGKFLIGR